MPTLTVTEAQKLLTNLPPGVTIELRKKRTGDFELNNNGDKPKTKEDILQEKYSQLIGQPITLSEAAKKYGVPRGTLQTWVYRNEYIKLVDEDSYPKTFDEADIAYCANIYKKHCANKSKAPLLDETTGLPYEIKHPSLAAKRRRRKKQGN